VSGPEHGAILVDGAAAARFTQADIDNGRVQYVEGGDNANFDGFTFQLFGPLGNHTQTEPFRIAILDHTGPTIATNNNFTLAAGDHGPINSLFLDTVALGSTPDQMTYTLLIPPMHGLMLNDGAPATSFSQADIDNGRVVYAENGDGARSDSFIFQVADAAGDYTAAQTFSISIQGASSDLIWPSTALGSSSDILASGTYRQAADQSFTFDDVSDPPAGTGNGFAPTVFDVADASGSTDQSSGTSTADFSTYWLVNQPSWFGDNQG